MPPGGAISRRDALRGVAAVALLGPEAWAAGARGLPGRVAGAATIGAPIGGGQTPPLDLNALQERLPATAAAIARVARAGRAGQAYVSVAGEAVLDVAWGETPAGAPMAVDAVVGWASAVKPTSCVAAMRLWEEGRFDLDDPVTRFIPEFAVNGKAGVRIRHLLTHTAHLGGYRGPTNLPDTWEELVGGIVRAPRVPYRAAGSRTLPDVGTGPGYNPAGIIVLAEIARRIDGRPFDRIVREDVYEPLAMTDSWCGMPVEAYREYERTGRFASTYMDSEAEVVKCQPAGGGIGPTRELGRFYEMMLGRGTLDGTRVLTPQTVEAMTTPKTGFGYMGVWGLGFNLATPENSEPASGEVRREDRFGPHVSPRTFGHPGATGMQAFADPEHGLVVTHIGRAAIDAAIYEDLRLV